MKRLLQLISLFFLFFSFCVILPVFNKIYADDCKVLAPSFVTYGDSFDISVHLTAGKTGSLSSGKITFRGQKTNNTPASKSIDVEHHITANEEGTAHVDTKSDNLRPVDNSQEEVYTITATLEYGTLGNSLSELVHLSKPAKIYTTCQTDVTVKPSSASQDIIPLPTLSPDQQGINYTITAHQVNGNTYDVVDPTDLTHQVNGDTSYVTLRFDGLIPKNDYDICLRTDQDSCLKQNSYAQSIKNNKEGKTAGDDGILTIEPLCNNGDGNDLQVVNSDPIGCKNNYFNEGQTYSVGLYNDGGSVSVASFYVYHVFPFVTLAAPNGNIDISAIADNSSHIDSKNINPIINNPIVINIKNTIKSGGDNRNNYYFKLESSSKPKCLSLTGATGQQGSNSTTFSYSDFANGSSGLGVPAGNYTLNISEQVNESGWTSDNCAGGFVYYSIPISVDTSGKATVNVTQIQKDPNNEETLDQTDDNILPPPCLSPSPLVGSENCDQLDTALGPIDTSPLQLMGSLMTFILSISGAIILLQLIYAGYQILLSRGDKEKVMAARQRITSSIIGFVFIVLSLVILQIIGVNILHIPGFNP